MDYKRIREYCEKATPGPWYKNRGTFTGFGVWGKSNQNSDFLIASIDADNYGLSNADFIVRARTDLPALLDRAEKLEKVAEAAEKLRKNQDKYEIKFGRDPRKYYLIERSCQDLDKALKELNDETN